MMNTLVLRAAWTRAGAVIAAGLFAAAASAQTNVCGPVSANTEWSLPGSPYVLTCDVVVLAGATLTIDPGVQVTFGAGARLVAQGGLISAVGSASGQITFASADPANPGKGVIIFPSQSTGGIFQFCTFSLLQDAVQLQCCSAGAPQPPVVIDSCTFDSNTYGLFGYSGTTFTVSNSTFSNNTTADSAAYQQVLDSTFTNNSTAVSGGGSTQFRRCSFSGGNVALDLTSGGNAEVYDSAISGAVIGIRYPYRVQRTQITGNTTGVQLNQFFDTFSCNDVFGNTTADAELIGPVTVNVPNNWWGTTTTADIDAHIKDGFDAVGRGFLIYLPFLTDQYANTPCACTPLVVTAQPGGLWRRPGQSASFAFGVSGSGSVTYQWYLGATPLVNGGRFSGVDTPTLTIGPIARNGGDASWTDAGQYQCVATNACNSVTSSAATLVVQTCAADFDANGILNVQDLFEFLTAWFAGCA